MLARQVVSEITNWANNLRDMVEHLARDWDRLKRQFWAGRGAGKSCRYRGGRFRCTQPWEKRLYTDFSSGAKIVYKPRELAVDKAWEGFTRWLGQRGL